MTTQQGSTSGVKNALAARQDEGATQGGGITIQQELLAMNLDARLPRGTIDSRRFIGLVLTEMRRTPRLAQCTRESFLGAVLTAAQLGLEIGNSLGQLYLVPYKQKSGSYECQVQIGYKGYIELASRSGILIEAREVHEFDHFEFDYGTHQRIEHSWAFGKERGEIVGYYGTASFADGRVRFHVMDLNDIEKRKARSKVKSNEGPWSTDPIPVSRKPVIRAMVPQLPLTTELTRALETDEGVVKFDRAANDTSVSFDLQSPDSDDQAALSDKTEARLEAERTLNDLLKAAPDRTAAINWLHTNHGPIDTMSDERLQQAIEEWESDPGDEPIDAAAEEVPPPDPTDPGPQEPTNGNGFPEPDAGVVASIVRMVTAWKEPQLKEQWGIWSGGEQRPAQVGAMRHRLIEHLTRAWHESPDAVEALF